MFSELVITAIIIFWIVMAIYIAYLVVIAPDGQETDRGFRPGDE